MGGGKGGGAAPPGEGIGEQKDVRDWGLHARVTFVGCTFYTAMVKKWTAQIC
jgi:hypothetical protein